MNSQQALELLDADRGGVVGTYEAKMIAVEALRSVVEGTDTPDYEAAWRIWQFGTDGNPDEQTFVRELVDAAAKGRRLVVWMDTDG